MDGGDGCTTIRVTYTTKLYNYNGKFYFVFSTIKISRTVGGAQVVEYLRSKCMALSSVPTTTKKKEKGRKAQCIGGISI
jgi:hypothetical protein